MSSPLYESGKKISELSVVVICKNNQDYFRYFSTAMEHLERAHGLHMSYVFVENGSSDETTPVIQYFLDKRDGVLVSRGNNELINLVDRPKRLGYLRNLSTRYLGDTPSDWTLLVDTDVYFNKNVLETLFSKDPSRHNLGMICGFGLEALAMDPQRQNWRIQQHYYDTAAFVADDGASPWPNCMFEGCAKCQFARMPYRLPPVGLLKVRSAFGGLALVRTELLTHRDIRWKAMAGHEGAPECEHLGLCSSIAEHSGMGIAIDCDTKVLWDIETRVK